MNTLPPDNIFGPQIHLDQRVQTHIRNLTGIQHRHNRELIALESDWAVKIRATTAGETPFDRVDCWYRVGGSPVTAIPLEARQVVWDEVTWGYVKIWEASLPPVPAGTRLSYQIGGRITGSDRWRYADNQAQSRNKASVFHVSVDGQPAPEWASKSLIYHIMVDRFYPGDDATWNDVQTRLDFYGGTLRGVIQKIKYIADLGFNTIWLSPIFASPTYHGYDSTDLYTVEPRFGTELDLEELISKAHSAGIRILLDFVPNHWSNRHPTFLQAQKYEDSPFREWYCWRKWPEDYETFFDVKTMPKLNLQSGSPAADHLFQVAQYWLQKGIDGYRIDHAEGPDFNFWANFRRVCLEANPNCWLFGEIVRPPPDQQTFFGSLHGSLDFNLAHALRQTFAQQTWSLDQFESFVDNHGRYFSPGYTAPAFFDNHDMNRFLFLAGGDKETLKLAALILFTLQGAPIVYYGTETGLSQITSIGDGQGFSEARLPMPWGESQDNDLVKYFQTLCKLRAANPIPSDATRRTIHLDSRTGTYAYCWEKKTAMFVVAINSSPEWQRIHLPPLPTHSPKDRLADHSVTATDDGMDILLAPRSGAFIQ